MCIEAPIQESSLILEMKRLAVEGRYRWPRDKSEVKPLTWQQFDWLMSGLEIEQPKAIGTYKNVDNLLPKNGDCEQFPKTSQSLENTAFLAVNEA